MHPPNTDGPTRDAGRPPVEPGRHVLVVDDEPAVRDVAARALVRHGFRVTSLPDARHALRILERSPGDVAVVVSDLHMPGMSGVELAERIRDHHPSTAVVLMSGLVNRRLREIARRTGVDRIIAKPFRLRDLARTVTGAGTAHPPTADSPVE